MNTKYHGTTTGYAYGCRCLACSEAKRNARIHKLNRIDSLHGTTTGYAYGCRCYKCRKATSERRNVLRKRQFDATYAKHGTPTGYQAGCRCILCKTAQSDYAATRKLGLPDNSKYHGTTTGYSYGCRCASCRMAIAQYWNKRRKNYIHVRLLSNLRSRLSTALRRNSGNKATKTMALIGCTVAELMSHLEANFKPGMTWLNYGKWHVDHIKACESFDLTDEKQQRACFNFTNLQPLWAQDNLCKFIS